MEGGRELLDQQENGKESEGAEQQNDKDEEASKIPDIGFKESTDADGEQDILLKEEYFAAAVSIYQMTREPRDLYVSRRTIDNAKRRFRYRVFPEEFLNLVEKLKEDKDIKMSEFVELMCKAGVSHDAIERQSMRMDFRLALI